MISGMRPRLRLVILQVPIGGDKGLPDAIQVGMAVRHARRPVGRETPSGGGLLGRGGNLGHRRDDRAADHDHFP